MTDYRGYEIFKSSTDGTWTILDERGSGHVEFSLDDCKATIDEWLSTGVITCSQCGCESSVEELHQNEGYCEDCCRDNQHELDAHNRQHDAWQAMSDRQREDAIRFAS